MTLADKPHIAITGALGNLGWKCLVALAKDPEIGAVVGLDKATPHPRQIEVLEENPLVQFVQCDLLDFYDARWREIVERVDAVVHFAAVNPFPDASWQEAGQSLDINLSVTRAAARSDRVRRMVYASSNHVMGGYREKEFGPGKLNILLPESPGTKWWAGQTFMDSTPYSVAKWAGERFCSQYARPDFTIVSIRIGWCQPGENRPDTISSTGTPKIDRDEIQETGDKNVSERWYLDMWLSNRDMIQLVKRAILSDSEGWPAPHIVVNGVSGNHNTRWSHEESRMWLNYQPADDLYKSLNEE